MNWCVVTLAAGIAIAGAANSATISAYDESIDGDAGHKYFSAADLGELAASTDVMTVKGGTGVPATDKRDIYKFSTKTPFQLDIDIFTVSDGLSTWRLIQDDGVFDVYDDTIVDAQLGSGSYKNVFGQQDAGDYLVWLNEGGQGVTTEYSLTISAFPLPISTVSLPISAVPLPAGGLLLLSGLVGVAALKRRKKRPA